MSWFGTLLGVGVVAAPNLSDQLPASSGRGNLAPAPLEASTIPLPGVQLPAAPDAAAALVPPAQQLPASPWSPHGSELETFVYPDIYGSDVPAPVTRRLAMGVPALARNRHLTVAAAAKCPLQDWSGATLTPTQPPWLSSTKHGVSPFHRMIWTVDDLIFYGWSLWSVDRAAPSSATMLLDAGRIAKERWTFDTVGRVEVDGELVSSDRVVLIPGPHEGILNYAAKAIRQAADLEDNAARTAANPSAYLDLHYTGERDMTPAEIDAARKIWAEARKGIYGGVGFTGKNMEVRELGAAAEHLLVEGRNAAAVNMARIVSNPATMGDATNAGASLTYETSEGRNAEFLDYGPTFYMDAIAARLSMDDVCPHGRSIRFDTSQLRDPAPSPTGPVTED